MFQNQAAGGDLDLGADIFGWFLLFDDVSPEIRALSYSRADIRPSNLPAYLEDLTTASGG